MTIPAPLLPIEIRAGLDVVALRAGSPHGVVRAQIVGNERLREELSLHARLVDDPRLLIVLSAEPQAVKQAVDSFRPETVVTLSAGSLERRLRRLRNGQSAPLCAELPLATWRALGYAPVEAIGVQGIGSLAWATLERLFRRLDRPQLADRCRIGMLRTLPTMSLSHPIATILVRVYRKAHQ